MGQKEKLVLLKKENALENEQPLIEKRDANEAIKTMKHGVLLESAKLSPTLIKRDQQLRHLALLKKQATNALHADMQKQRQAEHVVQRLIRLNAMANIKLGRSEMKHDTVVEEKAARKANKAKKKLKKMAGKVPVIAEVKMEEKRRKANHKKELARKRRKEAEGKAKSGIKAEKKADSSFIGTPSKVWLCTNRAISNYSWNCNLSLY